MALKTKRHPVIFSSGWDMRGSEVGEPVRVISMDNAWLSRDEIGAIESMPSDGTLADMGDGMIMTLSSGTNQNGDDGTKPWPGEAIDAGSMGILAVFDDGEIGYANYTNTLTTGLLLNTVTQPTDPGVHSIVRLNDTFYVFQGCDPTDRKPQKTVIASTAIDDMGVSRPDVTDSEDINISLNDTGTEVKGPVKYWISRIEQGNESALSEPLRRADSIEKCLRFTGAETVTFGNVHDFDMAGDFTVEALVNIDEIPAAAQGIFTKRADMGLLTTGWSLEVRQAGGSQPGQARLRIGDGTLGKGGPTFDSICDKEWHRLSFVLDDTKNTLACYRDGILQNTDSTSGVVTLNNGNQLTLGGVATVGSFVGKVSDVRIWDNARTKAAINSDAFSRISDADIADPPASTDYANLVGYWPCDEDEGTTLTDHGSGGNDGFLSTATLWANNESYGEPVIDAGAGSGVDINFVAQRFHGNTYNIYRSFDSGEQPFLVEAFRPTAGTAAFQIQHTTTYTCTMSIAPGGAVPSLKTTKDGSADLSYDLSNASYDEITELVAAIDGDGEYTCTIDPDITVTTSTLLDKVVSQDIQSFIYTAHTVETGDHIYQDDTHDDYLGNLPFIHGDEPQPLAIPSVVHINRIFLAYGSKLYWSDVANEESFWWADDTDDEDGHNETGNWVDVYPDDGDRITALVSDYDSIVIYKTNHIYRLYGRRPEEFNLRPLVAGASTPVTIGTPNQNSVCSTPKGLIFYWNRKVYTLNAGVLNKISAPIEEAIIDLSMAESSLHREYTGTAVGYWAERDQVWLSLATTSPTGTPTVTYIYDLSREIWMGQRGAGYLSPQSVRGTGIWNTAFSAEKFIGGRGAGAGLILDIASSSTAHTASGFGLSPFYGGDLNTWKKFLAVHLIYDSASSGDLLVYYKIDDGAETLVTMDMTVGDAGDRTHQTINVNQNGRALTIRCAAASTSWKVYGMTIEYQDQPVSMSR